VKIKKFSRAHPHASLYADHFGVQDILFVHIWNMEKAMIALYDFPEEMKDFFRRFADWQISMIPKSVAAGADIVFLYDDYGATNKPLISPEMWKEFTYPHLKRVIEVIHECGALAMLHSCGYQMPFLSYYVEAGLDILQVLQPNAGNDFSQVYMEYGKKMTFATGIDVQRGESMTPRDLREEILLNYKTGGRNGRHILGMTHMLQYTMPDENIRAIFDTVREIQSGDHD
jgi:uroporphyrinogen decarboxylase